MTLIELMIAMAIFAVMTASIMITFDSFQKGKDITDRSSKRLKEYQLAFNIISRDVQQILPRPITDEFGTEVPLYSMRSENGAEIEFTRAGWNRSPFSKNKRSELQRVSYYLEENKLMRATWRVLDRAEDTQPVRTELLEDVDTASFVFTYQDKQKAWKTVELWPPETYVTGGSGEPRTNIPEREFLLLPRVLEIKLSTPDFGDISRKFLIANCLVDVFYPIAEGEEPLGGGCGS